MTVSDPVMLARHGSRPQAAYGQRIDACGSLVQHFYERVNIYRALQIC
jgi:hypothetical protein